ncbi:hypothetical protein ACIOUE_38000 [Streptomyces xanthochromogenes]|uniref:hypothetical protein n=1 Tax=Streptomyces xanthochromogenes TaxID=67384 RepID=UPI003819324F
MATANDNSPTPEEDSSKAKLDYAKEYGLGGVMSWQTESNDGPSSLGNVMEDAAEDDEKPSPKK